MKSKTKKILGIIILVWAGFFTIFSILGGPAGLLLWFFTLPAVFASILLIIDNSKTKEERDEINSNVNEINDLYKTKAIIQEKVNDLQNEVTNLEKRYNDEKKDSELQLSKIIQLTEAELSRRDLILSEIKKLEDYAYTNFFTYEEFENISSEEIKSKLEILKMEQKDVTTTFAKNLDTDKRRNYKKLLRLFNAECDNILLSLTVRNSDTQKRKVARTYETLNNLFDSDAIQLSKNILEAKFQEFDLVVNHQLKKEQEKEEQREIKAQMVEEEKLRREIEQEKRRIEKEESQFKNEVTKLMAYLSKASDTVEKQLYVDKIRELEGKIQQLEVDKKNVFDREANTRAGYVYIISNIGSFGENIYKIGLTRRLEPMDRVKELGSASVPFEFDVHAMIFSDDAPTLENTLHKHFRNNQVNLVNPRKEFFEISLDEIEKVVLEKHNATVTFTKMAQAQQYYDTKKIKNEIRNSEIQLV